MSASRRVYVDVTNTLSVSSITGIQRVTTELLRRPRAAFLEGFSLEPVTHDALGWRRLTDGEAERLRVGPPTASWLRRQAGGSSLVRVFTSLRNRATARRASLSSDSAPAAHDHLRVARFEAGSVFFDCDAAWHVEPARAALLPELRSAGTVTAMMAYDTLPFERPEWFVPEVRDRFCDHVAAHLAAGSLVTCISEDSRRRLAEVGRILDAPSPDSFAIPLGSDGAAETPAARRPLSRPDRFALCVGTIEPRKNHATLLDAWERLIEGDRPLAAEVEDGTLGLVIVGRLGWRSDALAARLRDLHRSEMGVTWIRSADDAQLAGLYQDATVVVMPSLDEGLGLPVLEARRHAAPVLASDRGGLPEALGGGGVLCDPQDAGAWAAQLGTLLTDEVERQMLVHASAADPPPTWDDTARDLWSLMRNRLPPI